MSWGTQHTHKPVVFLPTKSKQSENEVKQISLLIQHHRIKYLAINLNKEVKGL